MSFMGLIIGTGILWLLKAILVYPLAMLLTKACNRQVVSEPQGEETSGMVPNTGIYILTDLLVLGIAGFMLGVTAGWFFVGITWGAKNWPGMIAFIVFSILGSTIHG